MSFSLPAGLHSDVFKGIRLNRYSEFAPDFQSGGGRERIIIKTCPANILYDMRRFLLLGRINAVEYRAWTQ